MSRIEIDDERYLRLRQRALDESKPGKVISVTEIIKRAVDAYLAPRIDIFQNAKYFGPESNIPSPQITFLDDEDDITK